MSGMVRVGSVLREQYRYNNLENSKHNSRDFSIDEPARNLPQISAEPTSDNLARRKRSRSEDCDTMEEENNNTSDSTVLRVARRIYVGNLAWKTSWQDLKDFFAKVGSVKYADILREGGPGTRSKGCGIVEFEHPEEAAAAIEQLNHTELHGRKIFIREDREDFELRGETTRTPSDNPRPAPKRPRAAPLPASTCSSGAVAIGRRVWVGNLGYDTTWQMLKDHFKPAGHVLHADIIEDSEGRSKGCGIVEFENPSDALRAISLLSNSTLDDCQIVVREDREDPGVGAAFGGGNSGIGASPRPISMRGGGGGAQGPQISMGAQKGAQVVIHGLPFRMAWQELKDLARGCCQGPVLRADVMTNPDGSSKGYGLLAFASPQDAASAIMQLNGRVVDGRVLTAKYDRFASS